MSRPHAFEAVVRAALQKASIVALPRTAPYSREGLRVQGSMSGGVRVYADQGGREGRKRLLDRVEAALAAESIATKRVDDDTVTAVPPRRSPLVILMEKPGG